MSTYINISTENLNREHICCAISDPKHALGVETKKAWLAQRLEEGHVFRKLDARGKVFIEYAPLENAWVPIEGDDYFYIYCLWVAGSFKGQGHATALLDACVRDAKERGKAGVCILSAKKKKPYVSDKKFMLANGFVVVDEIGDFELLALSFHGETPTFSDTAKAMRQEAQEFTIYYGLQCPFIPNCIEQIKTTCAKENIPVSLVAVDTLEKAKQVPCVFNNFAVFYKGNYITNQLLNEGACKVLLKELGV